MPPLTGPDRLLFDQVTASLREADHFEQIFEYDDLSGGVDKLRSIGRRVGRELGWKNPYLRQRAGHRAGARAHRGRALHTAAGSADGHPTSQIDQGARWLRIGQTTTFDLRIKKVRHFTSTRHPKSERAVPPSL